MDDDQSRNPGKRPTGRSVQQAGRLWRCDSATDRRLPAWLTAAVAAAFASVGAAAQPPVQSGDPFRVDERRILPIDEAFPWYVSSTEAGGFRITFHPAREHYLYRHTFDFRLLAAADAGAGESDLRLEFELPGGLEKNDQFFGDVVAYYDRVAVELKPAEELAAGRRW